MRRLVLALGTVVSAVALTLAVSGPAGAATTASAPPPIHWYDGPAPIHWYD
jgi:hypothetical protein